MRSSRMIHYLMWIILVYIRVSHIHILVTLLHNRILSIAVVAVVAVVAVTVTVVLVFDSDSDRFSIIRRFD